MVNWLQTNENDFKYSGLDTRVIVDIKDKEEWTRGLFDTMNANYSEGNFF